MKAPPTRSPQPWARARRRGVYIRQAALHPCQLLLWAYLPLAALFGMLVPALTTFVVVEVVLLGFVPNTRAFQRRVDARLHLAACASARKERAHLLAQMMEGHREELERIEVLADALRERVAPNPRVAIPIDDYLGIDRLLAMYVHGAITYCAGRVCLATASREKLRLDMQVLSEAVRSARTQAARALAASRLEVARMRAARWQRSCDELEVIQGQLSLIADLVRLLYEQSAAPIPSESLSEEIARALASAQETQRTVTELAELLADSVVPDPAVLRMGRQVFPETAVVPAPPASGPRVITTGPRVMDMRMQQQVDLEMECQEVAAAAATMRVR
jgi:hypothetical protein